MYELPIGTANLQSCDRGIMIHRFKRIHINHLPEKQKLTLESILTIPWEDGWSVYFYAFLDWRYID